MRATLTSVLLGLGSTAMAQLATNCPGGGVCYQLNVPSSTASKGTGDIFFQISAPKTFAWAAMGQGSSMSGSQIFVMYLDETGQNVTVSPRLGTGHVEPQFNSQAKITLLEGSGIVGDKMVANVKCESCSSWNGGQMDWSSSSGSFIWAVLSSGGSVDGGDTASISQHDAMGDLDLSLSQAKGGNSVNPFFSGGGSSGGKNGGSSSPSCRARPASATQSSKSSDSSSNNYRERSAQPTSPPMNKRQGPGGFGGHEGPEGHEGPQGHESPGNSGNDNSGNDNSGNESSGNDDSGSDDSSQSNLPFCDEIPGGTNIPNSGSDSESLFSGQSAYFKHPDTYLRAHGILGSVAFVILFPLGAIFIRLLSFPGLIWLHGAFQVFAYLVYVAAFGLGIFIANAEDLLHEYHPIIGIVLFVLIFFQPILGVLHHQSFKKQGKRSLVSYGHLWLGRIVITLGIINGGLGLMLADDSSSSDRIAYGVVAGIIWLAYVVSIVIGERRRANAAATQKRVSMGNDSSHESHELRP